MWPGPSRPASPAVETKARLDYPASGIPHLIPKDFTLRDSWVLVGGGGGLAVVGRRVGLGLDWKPASGFPSNLHEVRWTRKPFIDIPPPTREAFAMSRRTEAGKARSSLLQADHGNALAAWN